MRAHLMWGACPSVPPLGMHREEQAFMTHCRSVVMVTIVVHLLVQLVDNEMSMPDHDYRVMTMKEELWCVTPWASDRLQ